MSFSVVVVVGDGKTRVGVGLGKAPSVAAAVAKGSSYAKKHLMMVPIRGTTIPFAIRVKKGAAKILLKPAPPGTGIIAGGAVRAVIGCTGVKDIVAKVLGTKNQVSNVYATLEALRKLASYQENN